MNICEALLRSKETGAAFVRAEPGDAGFNGWARWDPKWRYRFSAEDLVASDWEPLVQEEAGQGA